MACGEGLLSDEHFSVDGTLIQAWARQKSFEPKDEPRAGAPPDDPDNPTVEARLYRKSNGQEAKLCCPGHVLIENRQGPAVSNRLTTATGRPQCEAGGAMVKDVAGKHRIILGATAACRVRGEPAARERIEGVFGWLKAGGLLRKTQHGGRARGALAAYDLVRRGSRSGALRPADSAPRSRRERSSVTRDAALLQPARASKYY